MNGQTVCAGGCGACLSTGSCDGRQVAIMSKNSRPFTAATVRLLVLLVVMLFGLTVVTDWLITSSENQEFHERYKEVVLGMSESLVVSLLGAPNKRSSEFYLGQREGFEGAYKRAAESEATHYLIWNRKADLVYAIGFNEAGNVSIVESGGT